MVNNKFENGDYRIALRFSQRSTQRCSGAADIGEGILPRLKIDRKNTFGEFDVRLNDAVDTVCPRCCIAEVVLSDAL
jgi:hypothetical protein